MIGIRREGPRSNVARGFYTRDSLLKETCRVGLDDFMQKSSLTEASYFVFFNVAIWLFNLRSLGSFIPIYYKHSILQDLKRIICEYFLNDPIQTE